MGKLVIIFFIIFINIKANVYENNCLNCHKNIPVSIDKYFYRYLLKYSSKKDVQKHMFDYLKNPKSKKTIMPDAFINRFGIKKRTKLNDENLKKALDLYWKEYKVFGKLK